MAQSAPAASAAAAILLLLSLDQCLHTAAAVSGILHVQFIGYRNPSSRRADGEFCDGINVFGWKKRTSACDPQISLCLGNKCGVGKINLPWISNSDVVSFGTRIGSVPNPTSLRFSRMPKNLKIHATILNHNRIGGANLIDNIGTVAAIGKSHQIVNVNGRTRLQLRMWVTCTNEYTGSRCQLYNYCRKSPCRHGVCRNRRRGFLCKCTRGWTGRRCEKRVNPCRHHPASVTHDCRVKFQRGKMISVAVVFIKRPVVQGLVCRIYRQHKTLIGSAAKKYCKY